MNIGRKIYYQLSTGNVILNTGEHSGSVLETTVEQDFQSYVALQPYQQSAVGVIQCDYGYEINNFLAYPFHVDITKNPIDQTAVVWDTNTPIGASLTDVQASKITQINDLYNQALATGFDSSASGTSVHYIYNSEAQQNFSDLLLLMTNEWVAFPYSNVYSAIGESITFQDSTQLDQLFKDIAVFKQGLFTKKHDFLAQVQLATTIDQVNSIQVVF